MRWTVVAATWPVFFLCAIAAAVIVGIESGSFWYGLLAFFVAGASGRALRALILRLPQRAYRKAIWPAAATGFAFLFSGLGLAPWATFLAAWPAASVTRWVLR